MESKKPHPSRLLGRVQAQNGLVLHPCLLDKNSGEISQEWRMPAPHQGPQSRVPVPGREVLTTSSCKNQQGLSEWKKLLGSQAVPLKEPTHRLTPSECLCQGGSLKGTSERSWSVWHQDKQKSLYLFWALPLQSHGASKLVSCSLVSSLRFHQTG